MSIKAKWLIVVALVLVGCKPVDEPAYPWGDPPPIYPQWEPESADVSPKTVKAITKGVDPPRDPVLAPSTPRVAQNVTVAANATDTLDDAQPKEKSTFVEGQQADAEDAQTTLSLTLLRALNRRASVAQRLEARRLNSDGVTRHKAKDWRGAVKLYQKALEQDPRAKLPRYNLACAYALLDQPTDAIQQLMALEQLKFHDKLDDARVDSDFMSLRSNPEFLRLTKYARVRIYAQPPMLQSDLRLIRKSVRKVARHNVELGGLSSVQVQKSTVFYRPNFEGHARTTAQKLGISTVVSADARFSDAPIDLHIVFTKEEAQVVRGGAGLKGFLDQKLTARKEGSLHQLRLKSSGFFVWKIFLAGGEGRKKRTGKYSVRGQKITFKYTETQESETGELSSEQKTMVIGFQDEQSTLKLGQLIFSL